MTTGKTILVEVIAVVLALVFAGLVLLLMGIDPIKILTNLIEGSFGNDRRISQMISKAVPLTIASLGMVVAFKMKFWNIGGEGQITVGAFGAALVALNVGDLPSGLMLPLMALCAAAFGAVWALIPAVFKVRFGTNETIFTLMLNYIAIKFVTYLQYGPWRAPESQGFPRIANVPDAAKMPDLLGYHAGWAVAVVLTIFVFIFMGYTKKGYEIAVVGESIETARYAGMNIPIITVVAMAISGGLCGIVGMIQVSAVEYTLVFGIASNYGFTAIITAWLSRLNAIATLFVCVAFSVLIQGASYIQLDMGVPASVAQVVQGIILFFVLGSDFFTRYKVRIDFEKSKKSANDFVIAASEPQSLTNSRSEIAGQARNDKTFDNLTEDENEEATK
jgi:simple sugar transport system permease protein